MKIQDLFEKKEQNQLKVPTTQPRNLVAKNAKFSGAGKHLSKKDRQDSRKPKHPHKIED
jgi:tRNA U38,U39,U40 pseudouridine synthase TruA